MKLKNRFISYIITIFFFLVILQGDFVWFERCSSYAREEISFPTLSVTGKVEEVKKEGIILSWEGQTIGILIFKDVKIKKQVFSEEKLRQFKEKAEVGKFYADFSPFETKEASLSDIKVGLMVAIKITIDAAGQLIAEEILILP